MVVAVVFAAVVVVVVVAIAAVVEAVNVADAKVSCGCHFVLPP